MKMIALTFITLFTMTANAQEFSISERKLINEGDVSQAMRIIQTDNPDELKTLQKQCLSINARDKDTQILANRMLLAMTDPANTGVGIAAPQVGINRKMIWVQRFDKTGHPFEVYLNIDITWNSKLLQKGPEGCLSIPETRAEVIRHYAIEISYETIEGLRKKEIVEDFTAIIFQHEVDHLNGILFPDRISAQEQSNYIKKNDEIDFWELDSSK